MNDFNPSKHCLGILCKRNHDWQSSGKTLRYIKGNDCVECALARADRWSHSHPEAMKESWLKYYEKNKQSLLAKTIAWRKLNRDKILENQKKYSKTPAGKQTAKKYRQSEKGRKAIAKYNSSEKARLVQKKTAKERFKKYSSTFKGKIKRHKSNNQRRLRLRQAHRFQYTSEDLKLLYDKFGNACAYCGSTQNLTVDHAIALSKGGSDVLGNLLPACMTCNCSKSNRDIDKWYKAQNFYSQTRWRKIQQYLSKEVCNGQLTLF